MRLLKLEVEWFRGLRSAEVSFDPHLTVICGPNELGKSTLAEAIRAAFLIPPGSAEAQSYLPWGHPAELPKVRATFEIDSVVWRVEKVFGTGTRAKATLEKAAGEGRFSRTAQGRDVEGRLRELLSWGISPPGGRGAPNKPQSFLSTALLGRQGDVSAVFVSGLTRDQDDTGRTLVTQALNALGQDPIVAAMVASLDERVSQVFTPTGQFRRGADAPMTTVRLQLQDQENRLREMEQAVRAAREVEDQVLAALAERDSVLLRRTDATSCLADARERDALAKSRAQAQKTVDDLRQRLDTASRNLALVNTSRGRVAELEANLQRATEERQSWTEALHLAQQQADVARAEVVRLDASRARSRELAVSERERQVAEHQTRQQALASQLHQLDAALQARAEAEQAEALLEAAREQAARSVGEFREAERIHERALAVERLAKAEGLARAYELARTEHEAAVAAESLASQSVTHGETILADAALARDAAAEALRQDDSRINERAVRVKELDGDVERARMALDAAQRELMRAEDSLKWRDRLASAQAELDRARQSHEAIDLQQADCLKEIAASEADLEELRIVDVRLKLRSVSARIDDLRRQEESVAGLRQEAAAKRDEASRLEKEIGARRMPTAEQVASWRQLQSEIAQHDAKAAEVIFPVGIVAALGVGSAAVSLATLLVLFLWPVASAALIALVIGVTVAAFAFVVARSRAHAEANRSHQVQRSRLAERWAMEVAPALAAASMKDLADFEHLRMADEASRRRVDALRREAREHDDASALAMTQVVALPGLIREQDELSVRDNGVENEAIAARLTAFAADTRGLLTAIRDAEAHVAALARKRERLNQEKALATTSLEAASLRVQSARVEFDRVAAEADLDAAVLSARAAVSNAQTTLEVSKRDREEFTKVDVRASRLELEATLRQADTAMSSASNDLASRRDDLRKAVSAAAEARTRLEVAEAALAKASLDEVREAARLLGIDGAEAIEATVAADRVDALRRQVTACEARMEALQASAIKSRDHAARLAEAFSGPIEALRHVATSDLQAVEQQLLNLASAPATASDALAEQVTLAQTAKEDAEASLQQAGEANRAAAEAESAARAALEGARAALVGHEANTLGLDVAGMETRLQQALRHPALTGTGQIAPGEPQRAEQVLERIEGELRSAEGKVNELRGKLHAISGHVGVERLEQQRELVERLRAKADDLQRDYEAERLLKERLEEAEAGRASHLGRALATPVTKLFHELTQGRYDHVMLDPDLALEGIPVAGETRDINLLSVGTREQLATLMRLAVAAHLKTAVVLDDQLVHSDTDRLAWFRRQLRASVREHDHQVIVFTCRPEDYIAADERKRGESGVRVVDLADIAVRQGSDAQVFRSRAL